LVLGGKFGFFSITCRRGNKAGFKGGFVRCIQKTQKKLFQLSRKALLDGQKIAVAGISVGTSEGS
jgi:hypothetical protein